MSFKELPDFSNLLKPLKNDTGNAMATYTGRMIVGINPLA